MRNAVRTRPTALTIALVGIGLSGVGHAQDTPPSGTLARADLEIVDCLLPGQVRQLGGRMTYLSARRPVRTTASDCRIRGGEYVAYDRADYASALRVWLPAAEAGDVEAMTNVGEIYERGLGTEPNYEAAHLWYSKAAEQGYARALFNLGTLYEQGLGVPQDRLQALNYYRRAWGLPEDSLIYQSAAEKEKEALRAELEKTIAEKDQQIAALRKQVDELTERLKKQSAAENSAEAEQLKTLRALVAELEASRMASSQRLASISLTRGTATQLAPPRIDEAARERELRGMKFGRYFALVIGNQHYQAVESLQTPIADAKRVAQILKDRYGFSVQLLEDADDVRMLAALNDLNDVLKPEDNVLIYYAGHGRVLPAAGREVGYWLPVNSDPPPKDTFWVANEQITAHLGRLKARRVLLVADSCYAGLLSNEPSFMFLGEKPQFSLEYVKSKLDRRARLLIASGDVQPVLDTGGEGHSVFARAFLDALEQNQELITAPALFAKVQSRVREAAARMSSLQMPQFKTIKAAGHEFGDFFFIPKTERR